MNDQFCSAVFPLFAFFRGSAAATVTGQIYNLPVSCFLAVLYTENYCLKLTDLSPSWWKKYRVYTRYTTREADRRTQIQTLVVESRCICAFTWTTQTCMLAKECNWILLLSADIVTCRTRAGLYDQRPARSTRCTSHPTISSRDFIATPTSPQFQLLI